MNYFISVMLLAISLAIGQATFGQDERLAIDGPAKVMPGQLVRLTATTNPNESAFWIVLSPGDLDYEQVDDGRKLIFAASCHDRDPIVVLLLAQQVDDGRLLTRQVRREIKIVLSLPGSEPPVDTPDPDDPSNSPLFVAVSQELSRISEPAREKRTLVAANFESVAAQCRSGQMGDIPAIWLTLSRMNHSTLFPHNRAWEPLARTLQQEFQRLGLKSVAEHADPLLVVAAALRGTTGEMVIERSVSPVVASGRPVFGRRTLFLRSKPKGGAS